MGAHKNQHVEEWNGKREITEKTFTLGPSNVPWLLATCVGFPAFVWWWTTKEFGNHNKKGLQPNAPFNSVLGVRHAGSGSDE